MKRNRFYVKAVTAILAAVMLTAGVTGCEKKSADSSGSVETASTNVESTDVKTITVGSGIAYKPYAYLDENGNAIGYEYDVLAALDDVLTQYEFKYDSMTFDNILLSLDTGKVDVAAHQFEYTDERAEKYLFSEESYTDYVTRFVVNNDNTDVNSIEDLAGKTVVTGGTTSATNAILNKYNQKYPDKALRLLPTDNEADELIISSLQSGAWAAETLPERDVDRINEELGNGQTLIKVVGEPINVTSTYYVFRKEDTQLRKDFDEGLKTLKENGTLSEISVKWFGKDFSGSKGSDIANAADSIAAKVGE